MRARPLLVIALLAVLAALLAVPAAAQTPGGLDGDPSTTERIADADPAAGAVAVSKARFPDGAEIPYAVLSRDDTFADSLAGSPLTGDAPLLFTATDSLTPVTRDELRRLSPPLVYVLGGTAAVSDAVLAELNELGISTTRLSGPERTATAVAIAREVRVRRPGVTQLAVARGFGPPDVPTAAWADSIAGGAWAARDGVPIVITGTEALNENAAAFIDEDAPTETVLLGGEAALSSAVEQAVPNPRRVAGGERAATAAAIAQQLFGFPASGSRSVVVFNAFEPQGWTRGLAAAGLAAAAGAPLLVVGDDVPSATEQLLASSGEPAVDVLVMGPTTEVSQAVVDRLDELDGGGGTPGGGGGPTPGSGGPITLGPIELVSVATDGTQGDDASYYPVLGGDGEVVVFTSDATTLAPSDGSRIFDTFVRDRAAETTVEVSGNPSPFEVGEGAIQGLSADNQTVLYFGQGRDHFGLWVYDRTTGTETLVDLPNTDIDGQLPSGGALSANGRYVAFAFPSEGETRTDDGMSNPYDLYRYDIQTGQSELLVDSADAAGLIPFISISGDGSRVAFSTGASDIVGGDTNQDDDVFVHEVGTGATRRVSVTPDGAQANGRSPDGGDRQAIELSDDGRILTFTSGATDLVAGGPSQEGGMYAADLDAGTIQQVNVTPEGAPSTSRAQLPSITADGRLVAFTSSAQDLTAEADGGGAVFVRDLVAGATTLAARSREGSVTHPVLSGDGRFLAFSVSSDDLAPGDDNGFEDVVIRSLSG